MNEKKVSEDLDRIDMKFELLYVLDKLVMQASALIRELERCALKEDVREGIKELDKAYSEVIHTYFDALDYL